MCISVKGSARLSSVYRFEAQGIATVDVLQSLAVVETQHLIRPGIRDDSRIGYPERAPCCRWKGHKLIYIPNTIQMAEDSIQLITGPNMSGKSTYMRRWSHDGGYGPAGFLCASGKRPFTGFLVQSYPYRAADDSAIVNIRAEMMERWSMPFRMRPKILWFFLMNWDEELNYDWDGFCSVYHRISMSIHKTLMTHYHELTSLSLAYVLGHPRGNFGVKVMGRWPFLHKIEPGPADKSYGIHKG